MDCERFDPFAWAMALSGDSLSTGQVSNPSDFVIADSRYSVALIGLETFARIERAGTAIAREGPH
jgi:hypothetical protein